MIDNMKADRVRKVADLANRRTRERFGRFLIEGPQSVREAVMWMPGASVTFMCRPRTGRTGRGSQARR